MRGKEQNNSINNFLGLFSLEEENEKAGAFFELFLLLYFFYAICLRTLLEQF